MDFGEAWGCSSVLSARIRRNLGWIGRLGLRLPPHISPCYLILSSGHLVRNLSPRVQDGEQAVSVSLVQFSPTRSIFLLFRCVTRLGSLFPYRHAANVIVFLYGEWWAFRVINLHLVKSDVWLTVNWVRSGQLRPKDACSTYVPEVHGAALSSPTSKWLGNGTNSVGSSRIADLCNLVDLVHRGYTALANLS